MGNVSGNADVGGILGCATQNNTSITYCYNTGEIGNTDGVHSGGIVGYNMWANISIVNCYNVGILNGKKIGGILGDGNVADSMLTITNCYFLSTTATRGFGNRTLEQDAQSLTEEEMKADSFVTSLNTDSDEEIFEKDTYLENDGYPILKWQGNE